MWYPWRRGWKLIPHGYQGPTSTHFPFVSTGSSWIPFEQWSSNLSAPGPHHIPNHGVECWIESTGQGLEKPAFEWTYIELWWWNHFIYWWHWQSQGGAFLVSPVSFMSPNNHQKVIPPNFHSTGLGRQKYMYHLSSAEIWDAQTQSQHISPVSSWTRVCCLPWTAKIGFSSHNRSHNTQWTE